LGFLRAPQAAEPASRLGSRCPAPTRFRRASAQLSDPEWQGTSAARDREWADELHELVEDLKAAKGAQT
jgi:hypothetical protein